MNCLFCEIIKGNMPSYQVYENQNIVAFLDINPVSAGHTLVVPKLHYKNMIDGELDFDMYDEVRAIAIYLKKKLNFDGFKIQVNNEAIADQLIMHMHFHIIPVYKDKRVNPTDPAEIIKIINE